MLHPMSSYQIQEINIDIKHLSSLESVILLFPVVRSLLCLFSSNTRSNPGPSVAFHCHISSFFQSRIALFYLSLHWHFGNHSYLFYGMALQMSSSAPANFNNQVLINTHQDKIVSQDIPGSMRSLMQREQERACIIDEEIKEAWYDLLVICGVKSVNGRSKQRDQRDNPVRC